ncbi:hypothetical protein Tco_0965923 [Tanacetum coccineum]
MAVLESCPTHNMVAYLEKTDGNTEFHEIISFLTRSSIHYALTETDIREKDEKSSKNGQNRARNGKAWKSQSQVKAKVKVNPAKSTVKPEADTEEYLMSPPEPI